LFIVNIFLIERLDIVGFLKVANIGFLVFYTILAFCLFSGGFGFGNKLSSPSLESILFILIFGIPVLAISHFFFLLSVRRRLLNRKQPPKNESIHQNQSVQPSQTSQPPSLSAGVTADERLAPLVKKIKDDAGA